MALPNSDNLKAKLPKEKKFRPGSSIRKLEIQSTASLQSNKGSEQTVPFEQQTAV